MCLSLYLFGGEGCGFESISLFFGVGGFFKKKFFVWVVVLL